MTTDNISLKKNDSTPFQRLTSVRLGDAQNRAQNTPPPPAEAKEAATKAVTNAPVAALSAAVSNISETSKSLREIGRDREKPDKIGTNEESSDSTGEVKNAVEEASLSEVRDVEVAANLADSLRRRIPIAPDEARAAQVERISPEVVQNLLDA